MTSSLPPIKLKKDDILHGFVVTDVTPLPEMRMVAYQLTHRKSDAGLLHLHTQDPENLFAIAFRTPPPDDTGLPHILEHTALCGSKKYPVKDPFVELLKTSLATFLNAMTYPDKTVYPCASMNEKDFFNLVDVYCDAALSSLITERHFKQEGHHLDFALPGDINSPLIIKGIVYNEMKGAYSDLDGAIERKTKLSICPDNAYGLDSGGDPDVIPTLTYDRFVEFYKTYYHPSNSLIFIYGNIPTEKHLAFLDREHLAAFDSISINTAIAPQPLWKEPRRETVPYPIGPNEDMAKKAAVVLTFLTGDATDMISSLSMTLLNDYLLGNAASPLRKALIDSKLGEDLTDSGYASYQRDTYFSVGLKGTEAKHTEAIANLVRTVCSELVEKGLEEKKVEATFHRLEIASREIYSRYPLLLMDRAYRTWLYDADPLHTLRLNEHLAELRRRYETEKGFFEQQLDRMIVDNPHFTLLTFVPDKDYVSSREKAFQEMMAARKAEMTPEMLAEVAREAGELDELQSAPNSPEALATLPRLALSDVPPEPFELTTTEEKVAGQSLLHTDIFSNGLSYLQLAFDLRGIEDELLDYLPLYADALMKMGAAGLDYAAMAEREAAFTGGVNAAVSVASSVSDCDFVRPLLVVSAKGLDSRLPQVLEIVADRILRGDLTDTNRLRDIVLQGRLQMRSSIIPSGNYYASLYAARHLSRNCAQAERLQGVTQLRMFEGLVQDVEKDPDIIVNKLSRIRDLLLARGRVCASFVGAEPQRQALSGWLSAFLGDLGEGTPADETNTFTPVLQTREGIATPAEVAFSATSLPAVPADHPDAPVLVLLSIHLSYGYLWNEVRVKRGAYGARAGYDSSSGIFNFSSYRDPCINETLETFQGVIDYIDREMDLSEDAMEQTIIGTVKTLDQPIRPGQAVAQTLGRYLRGETAQFRRDFRARLLSLAGEDIRRVAQQLLSPSFRTAPVCVLSSREKLEGANKTMGEAKLAITDL